MVKKVLIVYYTQSGQLQEIVDRFAEPMIQGGVSVETVRIHPQQDFAFPWTSDRFFDAMPESVLGKPMLLNPMSFKELSYDLIVIAYQPWFLSPSIPTTSLMHDQSFLALIKNTPVVTLIGARNMWLNAQEKMKKSLKKAGANLVGNVALVDRNGNLISAVTILHWMLTGRKDKKYGIFPKPGVSDQDIQAANHHGAVILEHLYNNSWATLQSHLVNTKAVDVYSDLMFIEQRAGKLFAVWAKLINSTKNRKLVVSLFKYYLLVALFMVAPVVLLINRFTFKPFVGKSIKRKKEYYLGVG